MNNYKDKNHKFQEWNEKKFEPSLSIQQNPEKYFDSLTESEQMVLCSFINLFLKYSLVFPGQTYALSRWLGRHRVTINRAISKMKKMGVLSTFNPGKGKSLYYKIAPFFLEKSTLELYRPALEHYARKTGDLISFTFLFVLLNLSINAVEKKEITITRSDTTENYNKEYIYKPTTQLQLGVRGFRGERGIVGDKKSRMRRCGVVEANFDSPVMKKLTGELRLTKEGQVSLSCFNEHVLGYGLQQWRLTKNVKNPFVWLFNVCKNYAQQKGIPIKWREYYSLREQYSIEHSTPLVLTPEPRRPSRPSVIIQEPVLSRQERYDAIRTELEKLRTMLSDPSVGTNMFLTATKKFIEARTQSLFDELKMLEQENNDASKDLCNELQPYTLSTTPSQREENMGFSKTIES